MSEYLLFIKFEIIDLRVNKKFLKNIVFKKIIFYKLGKFINGKENYYIKILIYVFFLN